MDHLPIPPYLKASAIPIECLSINYGLPKYDGLGFEGFLERLGTSEDEVFQSIESTLFKVLHESDSAAESGQRYSMGDEDFMRGIRNNALLQEWCWFGLLDEMAKDFDVPLPRENFLHYDADGKAFLNTSLLKTYPRSVVKRALLRNCPFRYRAHSLWWKLQTMCRRVEAVSMNPSHQKSRKPQKTSLHSLIKLLPWSASLPLWFDERLKRTCYTDLSSSLRTVANLLDRFAIISSPEPGILGAIVALQGAANGIASNVFGRFSNVPLKLDSFDLDTKMEQNFWCKSRLGTLRYLTPLLRYIASLLPSHDDRLHAAGCTETQCAFTPCGGDIVEPTHRKSCDCSDPDAMFEVREKDLLNIWINGGIPGLERKGRHCYEVTDVSSRSYVAISHVWTHGMGNSKANTLPFCQIERLFDYLRAFTHEAIYLWVDTLLVPVAESSKRIALVKLREVYKMATVVLVVDRYLEQVSGDHIEQAIQLLLSDWRTRLWTLQEGRLANALCIQFSGQAVSVYNLLSKLQPSHPVSGSEMLHGIYPRLFSLSEPFFPAAHDPTLRFISLINDGKHRRVTKKEDEVLCLATLMGIEIGGFGRKFTMEHLLQECSNCIPQDIVFVQSPKLTTTGFRWAPSTILTNLFWDALTYAAGVLGPHGLMVQTDSVYIPANQILHSYAADAETLDRWRIYDDRTRNHFYTAQITPSGDVPPRESAHFGFEFCHPREDCGRSGISGHLILLQTPFSFKKTVSNGILVEVLGDSAADDDHTPRCSFKAHLRCWIGLPKPFDPRSTHPIATVIEFQCETRKGQHYWLD